MEKLTHTAYRDPANNAERDGDAARREVLFDLENYQRPLERSHNVALHTAGVATGLEVRAAAGGTRLRVLPGTGITPRGDHVVLVRDGKARIGTEVLPVTADGVQLSTAAAMTGEYLLTIAWAETFDRDTFIANTKRQTDHTPLLALTEPAKATDEQLVLATVTLDAGAVRDVDARRRQIAPARLSLFETVRTAQNGELRVGSTAAGMLEVVPGERWELRVGADALSGKRAATLVVGDGEVLVPDLLAVGDAAVHSLWTQEARTVNLTVSNFLKVRNDVHVQGRLFVGVTDPDSGRPIVSLVGDPLNGTVRVLDGDSNSPGTLVGNFIPGCSAAVKQDIELLDTEKLHRLHDDIVATPVARFRYRGARDDDRHKLGVILEHCPPYLSDGVGINPVEYAAMLHAAVTVLSRRVDELTSRLAELAGEQR